MCGIAGILRTWQPGEAPPDPRDAIPEAWLDILDDSIKHRGPDGQGRFRQRTTRPDGTTIDVALVHRRLSIIDHADGHQPMVIGNAAEPLAQARGHAETSLPHPTPPLLSREGHPYQPLPTHTDHHTCPKCGPGLTAVAFNGCIYNHRELRRELEAAGHVFHTDHSDTEVLLHGWREWGQGMFAHLDGMFAAAIFDSSDASLTLARDLAGEKSITSLLHGGLSLGAFGSSVAGLTRLFRLLDRESPLPVRNHGPYEADPEVRGWLRTGGATRFLPLMALRDVPPASFRRVHAALTTPNEHDAVWWEPPERDTGNLVSVDWPGLLAAAISERLEADVPLGCFLSGGVDSGLVAAFAQAGLSAHGETLRTFSVRMPDPQYDESEAASQTARHLGTSHMTLECEAEPASDLVGLIEQLGLPFGDSSLLPTAWVSRATRQQVRVALAGDGGDELFGGYQRHAIAPFYQRWRWLLAQIPPHAFPSTDPKARSAKLGRLAEAARSRHFHGLREIFDQRDFERLTRASLVDNRVREFWDWRSGAEDPLRDDFGTYLPWDLLRKSDTASMSVALEVRSPLLSRTVIEQALSTPIPTLMPNGQRKGLLRTLARRYLPPDIVDRPKMGFAIPIGEWFRTDYGGMRQLLYDHLESTDPFPGLADAGVEINMDFVRRMLREHDAAGERSINPWHGRDHSQRLYMLVVLSIWCKWLTTLTEPRA